MSPALLECRGVEAGHGRVTVVRPFDLAAAPGTVVAVLGPNGSGKTTLLSTVAGLLPSHGGVVLVDGQPVKRGRPDAAARAGVVLVPDDRSLFSTLTVHENLKAATRRGGGGFDGVVDLFPALRARWNVAAGSLSGGEQQMLAMARALVQKPRVLLIDEMSLGLAPVIVESLLPIVRRVADETGAVVVLVEQHVGLALDVADEAVVLVHGAVALRGSAAALRADPGRLHAAYLGDDVASERDGKAVS
jgi:branched-chain amino acid transport system ATP-binding protein